MILTDLPLEITAEDVIRAQGLVFKVVQTKSPRLIDATRKAVKVGYPYLEPRVVFERYAISEFTSTGIMLENSISLEGELIKQHFKDSKEIVAAVCTVGERIAEFISQTFPQDIALAMALEALASSATEILGNSLCNYFDRLVGEEGLFTILPINPGMQGWPVEIGQPQIFSLIDSKSIGVTLEDSGLMRPLKSLSMIIGISRFKRPHQKSCDLCSLQNNCPYKPDPD